MLMSKEREEATADWIDVLEARCACLKDLCWLWEGAFEGHSTKWFEA